MSNVILRNVYKRYGKATVVHNVSLEISDKEFVVLVGPSGCGKSTVLRMIAGLEEVSEGSVYIGDRLVNDVSPKDRDIAMVFQNYALYPHMTVYDNLAFGLKMRKFTKSEVKKRIDYAAEILGIEELLYRKPKTLSGGQRQRVALGRAIVRKPKVFLLDEPLSNLDAKLRTQMRMELKKLHQRLQTTIIYVTHDQVEAMTLGNRIVVMNKGVILQVAAPPEIYTKPRDIFVAEFIGNPSINTLRCRVVADNGSIFIQKSDFRLQVSSPVQQKIREHVGKEIIMGIRPEDVVVTAINKYENKMSAAVETVELLGSEKVLTLNTSNGTLIASVNADYSVEVKEIVPVSFKMDKVTLFDVDSGQAIINI